MKTYQLQKHVIHSLYKNLNGQRWALNIENDEKTENYISFRLL